MTDIEPPMIDLAVWPAGVNTSTWPSVGRAAADRRCLPGRPGGWLLTSIAAASKHSLRYIERR